MNNLGEQIKLARKKNNLTQQNLADKLFVTPQAVSKWENNQGMPSLDKIKDLARVLSVDTSYFLEEGYLKSTNKKKWWLLGINALYYGITLVAIYTFSPQDKSCKFGIEYSFSCFVDINVVYQ